MSIQVFQTHPLKAVAAAFFFLLSSGLTNAAAATAIAASVDEPVMTLGQTNTYSITFQNASDTPPLERPEVPGLVFSKTASTHSSMRIFNGVSSRETRLSWSFQAERTGRFVIPGREIQIGGQQLRIEPVTVEVREMSPEMRNRFALRWKIPEGPFYVGQAIPATLQLFVRAGINAGLGSAPEGSSEQFIRTEFSSEPRQRQQTVDGQNFIVVEWDTVITPIQAGSGDLPISLLLAYETGRMQRDFFGLRPAQDQIRLTTESHTWTVRDLPAADRPDSFSGAVGNFAVQTKLSGSEVEVGEPLTLSMEVRGEGNFGRIQAPDLPKTTGWRIYPPRSKMDEEGSAFRGVKTFEYILTPNSEEVQETPTVAFSWFDPDKASWSEVEFPPEPVTVHPGSPSSTSASRAETAKSGSEETSADGSLHAIATSPGRPATLAPPWRQPVFWTVNGGLGCLLAFILVGALRKKKAAENPYLQVRTEATRRARAFATDAVKAAEKQDVAAFYTGARQALRHFLAAGDPRSPNPESLTWEDLEKMLRQRALPDEALAHMRELFNRKDAVEFAGWKPAPEELRRDSDQFETLLNQIVRQRP